MSPRPYNLGARTAAVAETREKVVAAARRLFAEAGFHRVSLDEIARQADVARATVYHQFGSKLGVLAAVVEDYERRAGLAALAELVESGPVATLARDVVTAGCTVLVDRPGAGPQHHRVRGDRPAGGGPAGRARRRPAAAADPDGRAGSTCPTRQRALDALWLLTGFAAYDDLTRGRGLSTARAAELLSGLAEKALRPRAD